MNHDPECVDVVAAYVEDSPHFLDLQTKADCSTFEESDSGEISSSPDQQSIGNVSPADLEQFTHIIEINEDSQPHHFCLQSEQQGEVFYHIFHDPIADFLESTNNVNVKIFFIDESWSDHLFEPILYMIWIPLLFESRSKMPVSHHLTWLHWKYSVT